MLRGPHDGGWFDERLRSPLRGWSDLPAVVSALVVGLVRQRVTAIATATSTKPDDGASERMTGLARSPIRPQLGTRALRLGRHGRTAETRLPMSTHFARCWGRANNSTTYATPPCVEPPRTWLVGMASAQALDTPRSSTTSGEFRSTWRGRIRKSRGSSRWFRLPR